MQGGGAKNKLFTNTNQKASVSSVDCSRPKNEVMEKFQWSLCNQQGSGMHEKLVRAGACRPWLVCFPGSESADPQAGRVGRVLGSLLGGDTVCGLGFILRRDSFCNIFSVCKRMKGVQELD